MTVSLEEAKARATRHLDGSKVSVDRMARELLDIADGYERVKGALQERDALIAALKADISCLRSAARNGTFFDVKGGK